MMIAGLLPHLAELGLSLALIWSLVCRARIMDKNTQFQVMFQHAALMAAALFGPMSGDYSSLVWASGITIFLLIERRVPLVSDAQGVEDKYAHILPSFKGDVR